MLSLNGLVALVPFYENSCNWLIMLCQVNSRDFTCYLISCNHVNDPLRRVLLLSWFYKWGIGGTESLGNLPKVPQAVISRAGTLPHSHQSDRRVYSVCNHTELPKHVPSRHWCPWVGLGRVGDLSPGWEPKVQKPLAKDSKCPPVKLHKCYIIPYGCHDVCGKVGKHCWLYCLT